jgi:hypothetical protein
LFALLSEFQINFCIFLLIVLINLEVCNEKLDGFVFVIPKHILNFLRKFFPFAFFDITLVFIFNSVGDLDKHVTSIIDLYLIMQTHFIMLH